MQERDIFDSALALTDLVAQENYVRQACGDNAQMREHLLGLLQAQRKLGSFLEGAPIAGVQTGVHVSLIQHPGDVIGARYKLLEQIGSGGMGAVWMAEQKEPVKRKVAIKLVKAGMDSQQVLARFEAERQALALMDHPNIAKVFDGGMTEQGRPFFVMEFVKGVPLTEYCNEARLSLKERLNLFIPVCQAVQHAHQKGIIHRDLKPSNILICLYDGKPVPKVIDFGLAKAMHQSLTENTIHTALGVMVGTPLYMSPEQAEHNNLDVDTRTDIYSLGVILYELLTGTTPLEKRQLKEAAYNEILRLIKEVEPPKPSTRLSGSASLPSIAAQRSIDPKLLRKSLSGDLDWIVMKSLDKERSRRYESANGLARDVERFLNHEAVEASPPSKSYRLRKLMQKHRMAIVTAAAFALVLTAGTIVSAWMAIRAMQAEGDAREALVSEAKQRTLAETNERLAKIHRIQAEKARDRTREALDAMTSTAMGDSLTIQKELSEDQKKFLTEVLKYYREFAGEIADDEQTRVRTAAAAFRVAKIEERLGRNEQGIAAYQMSRDSYLTLVTDFPKVASYRENLASSHNNLGVLLKDLGKQTEAEVQYHLALAVQEKLAADFPSVYDYRRQMADSHGNLANLLSDSGKQAEAEQHYRKALDMIAELVANDPTVADYRRNLAYAHSNLGLFLKGEGQRAKAEEHYRSGLAIREKLAADYPTVPDYQQDLASSNNNLGILLLSLGQRKEAEEQYRRAIAIREKLATDFPTVPEYRQGLANSHNSLGLLLGKEDPKAEQYRRALEIQEKLAAEFPSVPDYQNELARSHNNLGILFVELGKLAEADIEFRRGLGLRKKLAAEFPSITANRRELATCHNNLGILLVKIGKREEATEQYHQAQAIQEKLAADFPTTTAHQIDLAGSYLNYAHLVCEGGNAEESLSWFDKSIAIVTKIDRTEPRELKAVEVVRNCYMGRAEANDALAKFADAVQDWNRAIELSSSAERFDVRASCATSLLKAERAAEAVAEIAELTTAKDGAGRALPWDAGHWYNFACVYSLASRKIPERQRDYSDRAMELLQQSVNSGWKDAPHMTKDTDLDPLREREDFKKLVAELQVSAKAAPEAVPKQ